MRLEGSAWSWHPQKHSRRKRSFLLWWDGFRRADLERGGERAAGGHKSTLLGRMHCSAAAWLGAGPPCYRGCGFAQTFTSIFPPHLSKSPLPETGRDIWGGQHKIYPGQALSEGQNMGKDWGPGSQLLQINVTPSTSGNTCWSAPALCFAAPEALLGYQQLNIASHLLKLWSLQMVLRIREAAPRL